MAELFNTTRNNITMHIKNIFEEGELQENSVSNENSFEEIGTEYVTLPEMIKIYNDKGYKVEKLEDIMSNGELKYKVKMLIRNKKEAK